MNQDIFREYDIRGVADRDLTDDIVYPLGKAIGTFLRRNGAKKICVGKDCRVSSKRIYQALTKGLTETGLNLIDVGLVPTPLLYFSVFELKTDGGVMITGSHNPPEQNGFKIMLGGLTIHGEQIQLTKQLFLEEDFEKGRGDIQHREVVDRYLQYMTKNIVHPIPLKVVLDHGNGTSGVVAGELFKRLGCEVTNLFEEPDGEFPNHHPDPTVPDNLKQLILEVKKKKAHVGIAFDGDADRIGAVDPSGRILFGDELLILYARSLLKVQPGAKIISEVKASNRLYNDIESHGGVPIMWKTGHSLIKTKMKTEKALLAGEMSGHMFFADRYFGYDDAIYAGARLVELLFKEKQSPAEMLSDLPKSFFTPEIRVDCPDQIKFQVVEEARKTLEAKKLKVISIDGARVEFDDGWGLVRASNTQPVLVFRFEATSKKRLDEIRQVVEEVVNQTIEEVKKRPPKKKS